MCIAIDDSPKRRNRMSFLKLLPAARYGVHDRAPDGVGLYSPHQPHNLLAPMVTKTRGVIYDNFKRDKSVRPL